MRMKSIVTLALATAFSAASVPAIAADPGPMDRMKMTREQLAERDKSLYREYQRRKELLEKNKRTTPDPWTQRSRITVQPHEVEMRIERYVDGTILFSTPVEPKYEALLYQSSMFRKINTKDEINDRTVFNGRVYRVMRARGSAEQWKNSIGQDVMVKMQTEGGSQVALSVRVKR